MKKRNVLLIALLVALGAGRAEAATIPLGTTVPADLNTAITTANGNGDPSNTLLLTADPPTISTSDPAGFTTISKALTFDNSYGSISLSSTVVNSTSLLRTSTSSPIITLPEDFSVSAIGTHDVIALEGQRNLVINSYYATTAVDSDSKNIGGTFSASTNSSTSNNAFAISAARSVTINGNLSGEVTANAGQNYAAGIRGKGSGLNAGNITINGDLSGTVTASAGQDNAYGLQAGTPFTFLGAQTTYAGDLKITGDLSGDVTVTAGRDNAFGLTAQAGVGSANGHIELGSLSGTVTATATTGSNAYGIKAGTTYLVLGFPVQYSGDVKINGDLAGDVTATAYIDNAYGIYAQAGTVGSGTGNIELGSLSGTVTATATTGSNAYGLYAGGNILDSSNGNITINGSFTGDVYEGDDLIDPRATITVTAGGDDV